MMELAASGTARGDLTIGLDAGTSMLKAVAFDLDGNEVALAHRRNRHDAGPGGAATQEMARTWDDCASLLRDLGEQIPDLAARVAAVGVTGQGDGCWLIDGAVSRCPQGQDP